MRWGGVGRVGAMVALGVVLGACAVSKPEPSIFSYDQEDAATHDPIRRSDSLADLLGPQERDAVRRSGLSWSEEALTEEPVVEPDPPPSGIAGILDAVGRFTVAVLGVAVTLGMAAAPFLIGI